MPAREAFDPCNHTDAPAFALPLSAHPRSSDDVLSHFMALAATDDPASGEQLQLPPLVPRAHISSAAAARAVLEAAGGDLELAFDLHSWGRQQQQQTPTKIAATPLPTMSFNDALRHTHSLPHTAQVSCTARPDSCRDPSVSSMVLVPVSMEGTRIGRHGHGFANGQRSGALTAGNRSTACSASACCRNNIRPGTAVAIVEKHNQRSGVVTRGVVARVLTGSTTHPRGIKVQLISGAVGRAQSLS
jgi:uncharacterized repeat protein (TIGR03833 family)